MAQADHEHSTHFDNEEIDTIIRQAEPNDARAILALTRQVGQESNYLTFGPEGIGLSVQQEMELIERFMRAPTSLMLVAEVDDQIVGLANIAAFTSEKQAHVAEIGVSLVQEYWGYGIGGLLVEALIDFAKEVNLQLITLEVVVENERAVRLYERYDFEIRGTLQKRLKHECRYYDSYVMELLLKP